MKLKYRFNFMTGKEEVDGCVFEPDDRVIVVDLSDYNDERNEIISSFDIYTVYKSTITEDMSCLQVKGHHLWFYNWRLRPVEIIAGLK